MSNWWWPFASKKAIKPPLEPPEYRFGVQRIPYPPPMASLEQCILWLAIVSSPAGAYYSDSGYDADRFKAVHQAACRHYLAIYHGVTVPEPQL